MSVSVTCTIDDIVAKNVRKFRFAKTLENPSAYLIKIDRKKFLIEEDELFENIAFEDLVEEIPDDSPRYIVLSFKFEHQDGRLSYPLVFIYYTPDGCSTELNMLYASNQPYFQQKTDLGKVLELRDKEDLTFEWLKERLNLV
ncbi:glia maturation factor beta [Basidiobolus meristosporus CBS 931.73]|uniref:Glia maturation factor beta n=1 Tax=Basidiobolus meristosporus CBS 931.73 TaxID=1314790 RepID=A0A1Y1Z4R2_9FUNG|nr:glia maturation factor beta [Basidiobolus meristosporus CBS 931.73]|eukprot:ORY05239.1 glia maturation factor beta [Basidiobolus meristosporus CBS 931.73]